MKRLKIFDCTWHVAHQYDFFKLPHDFYVLEHHNRKWDKWARPIPDNVTFVPYYEPGKYDLAILHVDQQCIDPDIGKGKVYKQLNEYIQDIPKIVINHGTPFWPERFTPEVIINGGEVLWRGKKQKIIGMKEMIGDNHMIVNSHRAKEMWGWGKTIIHGMDPDDYLDLPKEPRAVCYLSPGGLDKYYNRMLLSAVQERLAEAYGIRLVQISVDWSIDMHKSEVGWDAYKDYLGRSLIYFNPTLESPMPRSRTEAMFSGCCVITTRHHGAEDFIEIGENGFIVPDNPYPIADLIASLINDNYDLAVKIGQKGKETAKKIFNKDRYLAEWQKTIEEVLHGSHTKKN